jgi:hypothetical protein
MRLYRLKQLYRGAGTCLAALALSAGSTHAFAQASPRTATPQIWFSMGALTSPAGHQSWDSMFYQPNASWPEPLTHVRVIGVLTQALVKIPDSDLAKVVARLKEQHIALGIEMLSQAYTLPGTNAPAGCGGGVEGYFPPEQTAALAAKIKHAGGTVQYIAMDEPLWFGHYYDGHMACHSSIENVAARVAANLREYQKYFPDVIVGDIEPFPSITSQATWQGDYKTWTQAFQHAVGKPISFLYVDINWGQSQWPQSLTTIAGFAHDANLPLGIIYNAAPPTSTMTNEAWLQDVGRNFTHIEKSMHIVPDWAMFTSWAKYPGHAVTDQYGLGEDYAVKQYLQMHATGK